MFDVVPTWEFQDEPSREEILAILTETKEAIVEYYVLGTASKDTLELIDLGSRKDIVAIVSTITAATDELKRMLPSQWVQLVEQEMLYDWLYPGLSAKAVTM